MPNQVNEYSLDYDLVYRKIRYPRLEFKTGRLLLILPEGENEEKILTKYSSWIKEKSAVIEEALKASEEKELCERSDQEFKELINNLVERFTEDLGRAPNKLFFRKMNSKWASCSNSKNITINMLLKYLPEKVISYVIYHEMLHLREKKHNEIFWRIIAIGYPEWKSIEQDLLIYWFKIQKICSSGEIR